MNITDNIYSLAKEYNAKFISLKFVNMYGVLHQIDSFISNLIFNEEYIFIDSLKLRPIHNKIFFDPFRSLPTIFCLCENLSNDSLIRTDAEKFITKRKFNLELVCNIEFTVKDKVDPFQNFESEESVNYDYSVEPIDRFVNLRADIMETLENIGIITTYHHHSTGASQCRIGFRGQDFLELADNFIIVKYIIENTGKSYGKSIDFVSGLSNEKLLSTLSITGNIDSQFLQILKTNLNLNSASEFPFMRINNFRARIVNNTDYKLEISFNNFKVNPYIVFSAILAYGYEENMKLGDIFSENI